jgi:NAD(P)-dependent dehydrogenase (short-subunit alcohol dehydrogenase family)
VPRQQIRDLYQSQTSAFKTKKNLTLSTLWSFMASTTALELAQQAPSLSGKWGVVTGATSGIGRETALALSAGGANVVLACRSVEAGEKVAAELRATLAKARPLPAPPGAAGSQCAPRSECDAAMDLQGEVCVEQLDLANLDSVSRFAARLEARLPGGAPDLLVLNAGVMATGATDTTADGFEMQLGTNHVGHHALVQKMLPAMRAAERRHGSGAAGRVVVLSSVSHKWGKLDLDDLHFQRGRRYNPWVSYAQSKLACMLLAQELARRLRAEGSAIKVAAVHPGIILESSLTRNKSSGCVGPLVKAMLRPFSKTPEQGAATSVYACIADFPSGAYLVDCAVAEPGGSALDEPLAKALFEKTEEMVAAAAGKAAAKAAGGVGRKATVVAVVATTATDGED